MTLTLKTLEVESNGEKYILTRLVPTNRISIHPGEILKEEFLKPHNMSVEDFAEKIGEPLNFTKMLLGGFVSVTPLLADKFSVLFGTTVKFWLNLQESYDRSK